MRRDVFQAIADPTRRSIIHMVAKKSLNLNAVAKEFDVSRPAISKHIKILTECGLVTIQQKGRERFCEAKVEKLTEVSDWLSQFREMWEAKFDSLDNYLNEIQEKPQTESKPVESVIAMKKQETNNEVVDSEESTVPVEEEQPALAEKKEASPAMPKFLSPKKTTKAKPKKKVKAVVKAEPAPKPKKKKKEAPVQEETPDEVAPNQYSLF